MAEKKCANCGAAINEFATPLHEELGVCSDECGIDRVSEKDQDYSRAERRLGSVRRTLKQMRGIDPRQHERGYPGAFGAAEMICKFALIEAGEN